MTVATTYPAPAVFFCVMAGIIIQFFVIVGCLLGLGLSFFRKTIDASFLLAAGSFYAAVAGAVLIGLSALLDLKNVTISNYGSLILLAVLPTMAAAAIFAWSSRQKNRWHDANT